jgi:hypothetical protein
VPDRPEPFAQTNLQLLAQLRRAGWAPDEVEAVAAGYRLAAQVLAGWYRPSGKPFVDHFVGTASVAAAAGARPAVVRAALLHNAYGGVLASDGSPKRRQQVRAAIGPEAEHLVWAFSNFAWDDAAVLDLLARVDDLTPLEHDLVVLRLANEVDDHLDLGLLHSRQDRLDDDRIIELADAIDDAVLADALRRVAREEAAAAVEPGVRSDQRLSYFVGPPPSPARRAVDTASDLARRVVRRLRRVGR